MSYIRVIPRDLFNEANLLKCYGQIYLNLEKLHVNAELVDDGSLENESHFRIYQDESSGGIFLLNVYLLVRGKRMRLERPMNSRKPYPLYLYESEESDAIAVFNDDGSFSAEMLAFLKGELA